MAKPGLLPSDVLALLQEGLSLSLASRHFERSPNSADFLEAEALSHDKKATYAQNALRNAVRWGNEVICQILLSVEGVNVEGKYEHGRTPIFLAVKAYQNMMPMVKLLRERYGANPKIKDNKGRTMLAHAVCIELHLFGFNEVEETIRLLLDTYSLDVNEPDNEGHTPLHYAVLSCHPQDGLSKQMRINIEYVSCSIAQLLLDKGARINNRDNNGKTPLCYAAQLHAHNMVKLLLERGADIDCKE